MNLFEAQGPLQLDFDTVDATLERLIIRKVCHRVLGGISFSACVDIHNHLRQDAYYAKVQYENGGPGNDDPNGSAKDDRPVIEVLSAGLAKVIGVEPSRIDPNEEINTYAFDSLTLTQVRGMIARDLRVTLPLMRLYNNPTIQSLANEIQGMLTNGNEETHKDSRQTYQLAAVVDLVKEVTPLSPWIFKGTGAGKRVVCFHSMEIGASLFTPFLIDTPPRGAWTWWPSNCPAEGRGPTKNRPVSSRSWRALWQRSSRGNNYPMSSGDIPLAGLLHSKFCGRCDAKAFPCPR